MPMRKTRKWFLLAAAAAAAALSLLPIMQAQYSDGEWGRAVIHGYDLMEFSAWGYLPLLAPLLAAGILFGHQPVAAREAELLLLFGGSLLSCVHSCNSAQQLLTQEGLVLYAAGFVLYPLGLLVILAGAVVCILLPNLHARRKPCEHL